MLKRVVEPTSERQQFSLAEHVLSIRRPLRRLDAIVVYQGLGEDWRVAEAVEQRNVFGSRLLLLAAFNKREETSTKFSLDDLQTEFGLIDAKNVVIGDHAEHTPMQAEWLCDLIEEHNIGELGLVVSQYHIVRGWATTIATMNRRRIRIPVYPIPTQNSPELKTPEFGVPSWEMAYGESARIVEYQEKGDVLTYGGARMYLDWYWKLPKALRT